jgi:tripeptide aminopeptidase
MSGSVDSAELQYIIRDHDRQCFERRKAYMISIANFINYKYGDGTVAVNIEDRYFNMRDKIMPHMELIDLAKKGHESHRH